MSPRARALLDEFRDEEGLGEAARKRLHDEIASRVAAADPLPHLPDVPPPELPAATSAPAAATTASLTKLVVAGAVAAIPLALWLARSAEPSPDPASVVSAPVAAVRQVSPPPTTEPALSAVPFAALPMAQEPSARPRPKSPGPPAHVEERSTDEGAIAKDDPIAAPDAIDEDVRLLAEAKRSLNAGDPRRALALLKQHENEFPKSALSSSRAVTRALALCAAGDVARGRGEAAALLAKEPSSPFASRLKTACGLP